MGKMFGFNLGDGIIIMANFAAYAGTILPASVQIGSRFLLGPQFPESDDLNGTLFRDSIIAATVTHIDQQSSFVATLNEYQDINIVIGKHGNVIAKPNGYPAIQATLAIDLLNTDDDKACIERYFAKRPITPYTITFARVQHSNIASHHVIEVPRSTRKLATEHQIASIAAHYQLDTVRYEKGGAISIRSSNPSPANPRSLRALVIHAYRGVRVNSENTNDIRKIIATHVAPVLKQTGS